jgi:menaquinone-dependent protoporphyrinogen oxidase
MNAPLQKNYHFSKQIRLAKLFFFVPVFVLLPILSGTFAGFCASNTELVEKTYGTEKTSTPRILVAYATRAGSTVDIAEAIAKKLAESKTVVDLKPVKNVQSLNGYQAVVLGSAIRRGAVLPEIMDFIRTNKEELSKLPVACFIVCMILREDNEENRKKAVSYLEPLRAELSLVDTGMFAGKLDYSKLNSMDVFIIKYIIGTPEGDLRDWQKINDWAENLSPKLLNINKER